MSRGTAAVVIGAGPGLGLSIARRFGREGYAVELVSRSADRHAGYLAALSGEGVEARAHAADVRDRARMRAVLDEVAERHDGIGLLYYGPASLDPSSFPVPITEAGADAVRESMEYVYPAVDAASAVLPGMIERGDGGLLFAGGLSSVVPMPQLGNLAVPSAALRNYVVTLNAGLAGHGVYAGTLTIGGAIARGDIHTYLTGDPERFGDVAAGTLDPDDIAGTAWEMFAERGRAEVVFNAIGGD